jgi:hypothetical protein
MELKGEGVKDCGRKGSSDTRSLGRCEIMKSLTGKPIKS